MNSRHRAIVTAVATWAALAAVLAVYTTLSSNADAMALVAGFGVVGVGAAAGAAFALHRRRPTLAAGLLILSACTPTGYLYAPNVFALVAGLVMLVRPRRSGSVPTHV